MPLTRYQIRNEYSLADPELYRAADKDDPEALLEGVAMAGLVGVLRQLGDLAEFAAEIFHDLHEEVMATSARGHGLMVRVQQLEAEFPSIEKAFLSQTNHSSFYSNTGIDWHPNLHMDQNLITQGDLPRFIMDSYEECRGPPRLFLLDKFDVAGAGACLKRYTDPSFFKVEPSSYEMISAEVQREKKPRKAKKKSSRWRNGETPEGLPTSHAKLHQLFLEERVASGVSDPARLVKLKRRLNGFPFNPKTGKSYMEKFLTTPSPEHKVVHEISVGSPHLKLPSNIASDSGLEISTMSSGKESVQRKRSPCSSPYISRTVQNSSMDELCEDLTDAGILKVLEPNPNFEAGNLSATIHKVVEQKEREFDGESKADGSVDGYQSDDIASEIDNYMDALATMESEIETDNEFRAKNDPGFLNIEKQGTDSDANEEQLRAQFSDSQSVGNSTASDDGNSSSKKGMSSFSCSDTQSTSAENMPSDGDVSAKAFQSTEAFEAEITDESLSKVCISEEVPVTQCPEHEFSNGACIKVAEIPRYRSEFEEPSSSSFLKDSAPAVLPVDPGAILDEGTLEEQEFNEISSDCNELDTEFIDKEENGANLYENIPGTSKPSDFPIQARDDFSPMLSAENHPMDKLDDEDPNAFSNASVDFSNILEVPPGKNSGEKSLDNVLQTEYAEDSCTKNLVDNQISSPHSVMSHAEEQPFGPSLLEFETYPDVKPSGIVSVDDAIPSAGEIAVIITPAVDSPDNHDFKVQQALEITDDVPSLELDSSEVGISYSVEKILDGSLSAADGEEMNAITRNMDLVGSDSVALECPADFTNSSDSASLTEVHVHFNEKETKTGQSEAVVMAGAVASSYNNTNEDDVTSPSANFRKLQEECLSSFEESEHKGSENHEACLPQILKEPGTQNEVNQQAVASPDSNSILCNTVSYYHSVPQYLNNVPNSSLAAQAENSLHLHDAPTVPSSSVYNAQDSESKFPNQSNFIENTEDASSSPTHFFAELGIPLEQKVELQADKLDMEPLCAGEESSKSFSQLEQIQSSNHMDHERDFDAYAESCSVHLPSQPLEQKVEIQIDQHDVESLHVGEASLELSSQLEEIQSVNHMDHERRFDASSESCPAHIQSKASVLEFLPQSGCHTLDVSEQATDPLSEVFPGFGMLPQATQINLEEMPPLPPLPPMQWRIGKLQHASLASKRDAVAVQYNVDPSLPVVPSNADEDTQLGYPALEEDIIQPLNPFLPLPAVKDENSQCVYEHLAGNMVQSSPLSLQMSTMSNHRNSQDDSLTLVKTQSMNPFLTLPPTYDERLQHGFLAGEGGTVDASLNPFSPVATIGDTAYAFAFGSPHGKQVQPPHQLPSEASLNDDKLEHTSIISKGKVVNPPETIVPPPTIEDEQPQYVFPISEGEIVWSSSMSYLLPAVEDGKPNGNRLMKLLRPRSPLIEAVAAHDKSKLRKVTERIRPQIQKVDERDSLLEQIRTKSFNLKPAVATRPSIQGPNTNLKVAAILEKANAIRQALAGSDEDDDADSWSDS